MKVSPVARSATTINIVVLYILLSVSSSNISCGTTLLSTTVELGTPHSYGLRVLFVFEIRKGCLYTQQTTEVTIMTLVDGMQQVRHAYDTALI